MTDRCLHMSRHCVSLCTAALLLAVPPLADAQAPPAAPYIFLSSASIDAQEKKLAAQLVKLDKTKAVNETLSPALKNHRALMFHRDAGSPGEIHEQYSDFAVVRSGSGTVKIGGKILSAAVESPGEIRGTGMEGGTTIKFSVGDMLYIPAKIPHQFVPDPGQHLTVLVFKPVGIQPQDLPREFVLWTKARLDSLDKNLMSKLDPTRGANETLVTSGNTAGDRRAVMFHQAGQGPSEVHERKTEFVLVRSGSGTAVLGGTRLPLAAGDVVYIPEGTPHQFVSEPGKPLSVMEFEFPAK